MAILIKGGANGKPNLLNPKPHHHHLNSKLGLPMVNPKRRRHRVAVAPAAAVRWWWRRTAVAARQHDFFLGYLGGCFEDCFGCRLKGLKYCFWKV